MFPLLRVPWFGALALALTPTIFVAGSASAHGFIVDGDLMDLIARAQAQEADGRSDVSDVLASGWDFTHVYTYFSPKTDELAIGIDLLDSVDHAGVPGDADGDRDPNGRTRLDVPEDQFGVGADEAYIIAIDTDVDGQFDGASDLIILYRDNRLRLLTGEGNSAPAWLRGTIALGVKGALVDPMIPNENRETEDIEIALENYSTFDLEPCRFVLSVFAGSLVDALDEDRLDTEEYFEFPEELTFRNMISIGNGFGQCAEARPGDELKVRSVITNQSAETLQPVFMVHYIPDSLQYVNGSLVGAHEGRQDAVSGGVLVHFIRIGGDNSIAPGESEAVRFRVRVRSLDDSPQVIRGLAEGRVQAGGGCMLSCLDAICVKDADSGESDSGNGRKPRWPKRIR